MKHYRHHNQVVSSSSSSSFVCTIMAVALASLSMLPHLACATTEVQETPLALPVGEQTQPTTASQGEIWEEDDHEILIRNERGTKNDGLSCRYGKNPWTECDTKTNTRSRTLTLKKGDPACDQTRTIQKKCKKACRYEKGSWSECATGQMTRADKLKATSDPSCEATRVIKKNCKPGKSKDKTAKEQRKNKDKGARKGRA
uniref:PTN/MK heparin-binding protein family n=1 Tax=Musca domestica TaxID=7370 RepID=T1PHZ8_MUSDO